MNTNVSISAIFFDLDGTLIDSSLDILNSLKQCYARVLPELKIDFSKALIGPPVVEIVNKLTPNLPVEKVEELRLCFRSVYDFCGFPSTLPYPEVNNTLQRFRDNGVKLFIATNKPSTSTLEILEKFHWNFFHDVICIDQLPKSQNSKTDMLEYLCKKHSILPSAALMVGDMLSDIQAGKDIQMLTAAAIYGYEQNKEVLTNAKPDILLYTFKDIINQSIKIKIEV